MTTEQIEADLVAARETLRKVQAGEFEIRRGDKYFAQPNVPELRKDIRRMEWALAQRKGGNVFQGVTTDRTYVNDRDTHGR